MMRAFKWFYVLLLTASMLIVGSCVIFAPRVQAQGADEQEIVKAMKATFDRPDAPLIVDPVVVQGDAAIAGWSQQQTGGRAFLRKRKDRWLIVLCSGDQLKAADTLVTAGLSKVQAKELEVRLAVAEKSLPAERLALFAKFDGLVNVEEDRSDEAPKGHNH
ncbi:MAG: copper uptake system-associated protein [Xanthobacteraceae bacterium]|nr:copper uptake system-associated protein [Xanthobacteraceae bacterium]